MCRRQMHPSFNTSMWQHDTRQCNVTFPIIAAYKPEQRPVIDSISRLPAVVHGSRSSEYYIISRIDGKTFNLALCVSAYGFASSSSQLWASQSSQYSGVGSQGSEERQVIVCVCGYIVRCGKCCLIQIDLNSVQASLSAAVYCVCANLYCVAFFKESKLCSAFGVWYKV